VDSQWFDALSARGMAAPDGNRAGSWIDRTRTGPLSLWFIRSLTNVGVRYLCPRDFNIPSGVAYFLPRGLVEVEVDGAIRIELSGVIVVLGVRSYCPLSAYAMPRLLNARA